MNTPDFIDVDPDEESFSAASGPEITFQGNNYDLTAIVGATGAAILLISCGTLGLVTYCLPVAALVVGFIGLRNAKDAVNPERTRQLSWVSIGVGGVILIGIILLIILYVILIVFGIAAGGIENF